MLKVFLMREGWSEEDATVELKFIAPLIANWNKSDYFKIKRLGARKPLNRLQRYDVHLIVERALNHGAVNWEVQQEAIEAQKKREEERKLTRKAHYAYERLMDRTSAYLDMC
jgi:hypothetical protein